MSPANAPLDVATMELTLSRVRLLSTPSKNPQWAARAKFPADRTMSADGLSLAA